MAPIYYTFINKTISTNLLYRSLLQGTTHPLTLSPMFTNLTHLLFTERSFPHLDPSSTPSRLFRMRLLVWCLLLLQNLSTLSLLQGSNFLLLLSALCIQILYVFYLFTRRPIWTLGFLALLSDFLSFLSRLDKHENLLSIPLITLSRISLYTIQGFPMIITCASGLLYYILFRTSNIHINKFYEYFTDTYTLPAETVHLFNREYLITLSLLVIHSFGFSLVTKRRSENHNKMKQENFDPTSNELNRLRAELKQVLQSQDLLVTYMSHELRNHLNIMLGNLDILFDLVKDQGQAEILKLCKVCGDILLSQINNLLDVAKINTGRLDISEFPTKMSSFVNEFWMGMKQRVTKKGLTGELVVHKNFPLWTNLDNHRLHQILHNLVDNAVKFTSKGSVTVVFSWIETSDEPEGQSVVLERESIVLDQPCQPKAPVTVRKQKKERDELLSRDILRLDGNLTEQIMFNTEQTTMINLDQILMSSSQVDGQGYLKVEIKDTGCGIPEGARNKIFDPFVQGDSTITRHQGGSGLGLFIAKRLIEKMNGTITLESKVNVGSCFQVVIPVASLSQEGMISFQTSSGDINLLNQLRTKSAPTVCRLPPSSPKKFFAEVNSSNIPKRVLIVDDIEFNRNLMQTYFKTLQFETDLACNGLEALRMYQDDPEKYFLITMDIQMPVMDGLTACKSIRSFEKRIGKMRKVPIIVVTGNCDDDGKKAFMTENEGTANYFFRKPFGFNECKLCIQKILKSQSLRAE